MAIAVRELSADDPMRGKTGLAALLRGEGYAVSGSAVGSILSGRWIGAPSPPSRQSEGRNRGIDLSELPPGPPNPTAASNATAAHGDREFHISRDTPDDLDDLNRSLDAFADGSDAFRPLDGQTPADDLRSVAARETSPSHRSRTRTAGLRRAVSESTVAGNPWRRSWRPSRPSLSASRRAAVRVC